MDAINAFFADLHGLSLALGAGLGLLVGKPVGICLFTAIATSLRLGDLPNGTRWPAFVGMSFLCGIGFTMSLFVANLAHQGEGALIVSDKIGILLASVISAVIGYLILKVALKPASPKQLSNVE